MRVENALDLAPRQLAQPVRRVFVPDQRMGAQRQAAFAREGGERVGGGEVEAVRGRAQRLELKGIIGGDEPRLVGVEASIGGIGKHHRRDRRAKQQAGIGGQGAERGRRRLGVARHACRDEARARQPSRPATQQGAPGYLWEA